MGYGLFGNRTLKSAKHRSLERRNREPRARRRAFLITLAAALLALAVLLALLLFPPYAPLPATGEYPVGSAVFHWSDAGRAETYGREGGPRTLAVEMWYPQGAQARVPLALFSHGAFGSRGSNESLFRELASHGYVVCSLDHTYQCLETTGPEGKKIWMDGGYAREVMREDAKKDKEESLRLYRKWMDIRTGDIRFVLDTILSQAEANPGHPALGLVDPQAVALIGHSLGGSAALGVGRSRSGIAGVIALEAPFLCDITAVERGAFVFEERDYPVPVLCVYSDSAWPHLAQWPQYAQNARLLRGEDRNAQHVYLQGTGHLALTDLALVSPVLTALLDGRRHALSPEEGLTRLNEICLSFLDRVVKGKGL